MMLLENLLAERFARKKRKKKKDFEKDWRIMLIVDRKMCLHMKLK